MKTWLAVLLSLLALGSRAAVPTNAVNVKSLTLTTEALASDCLIIDVFLATNNYATKRISLTNFFRSASGWNSGLPGGLPWAKLLFVDPTGADASAQRENPSRPFYTLASAQSNALAGDTIVLISGTYAVSGLGKDGVNWFINGGATITASPADSPVFALTNLTCSITGAGTLAGTTSIYASGSTVEIGCVFSGIIVTANANTIRFNQSSSTHTAADWLDASVSTSILFQGARALRAPNSLGNFSGDLSVP